MPRRLPPEATLVPRLPSGPRLLPLDVRSAVATIGFDVGTVDDGWTDAAPPRALVVTRLCRPAGRVEDRVPIRRVPVDTATVAAAGDPWRVGEVEAVVGPQMAVAEGVEGATRLAVAGPLRVGTVAVGTPVVGAVTLAEVGAGAGTSQARTTLLRCLRPPRARGVLGGLEGAHEARRSAIGVWISFWEIWGIHSVLCMVAAGQVGEAAEGGGASPLGRAAPLAPSHPGDTVVPACEAGVIEDAVWIALPPCGTLILPPADGGVLARGPRDTPPETTAATPVLVAGGPPHTGGTIRPPRLGAGADIPAAPRVRAVGAPLRAPVGGAAPIPRLVLTVRA